MDYEQDYDKNPEFFRENPIGSVYNEISEMKSTSRKNGHNSYNSKESHSRLLLVFGFFLGKGNYKGDYNKQNKNASYDEINYHSNHPLCCYQKKAIRRSKTGSPMNITKKRIMIKP